MRKRAIDGILLVDKPAGMTSHDVINVSRRALGIRRIGHAGTLDPFATGLLVVLVGKATRLLPYLDGEPKVYRAEIRFGTETDTDDSTGTVTVTAPIPAAERIRAAVEGLTGTFDQQPPAYSARQVGGERSYSAARQGRTLALAPAAVTVHAWEIHSMEEGRLDATIICSGGTYIRALARDLGRSAGGAAHLGSLRRTASGPFTVEQAVPAGSLGPHSVSAIRSPLNGLRTLAVQPVDDAELARIAKGQGIAAAVPGDRAALTRNGDEVVAIALRVGHVWAPKVVLHDA